LRWQGNFFCIEEGFRVRGLGRLRGKLEVMYSYCLKKRGRHIADRLFLVARIIARSFVTFNSY